MKVLLLAVLLTVEACNCFYLTPNIQGNRNLGRVVPIRNLEDLFGRLLKLHSRRCVNLFDESCANGGLNGAGSDDDWLNGGNTPGKRCANLFDEGCSNDNLDGAGSDDDWLNGGGTPGKRGISNPRFASLSSGRR